MSNDPNNGFTVRDVNVQRAGHAEILREYTWGGPNTGRDTRLIFEPAVLEELMKVSKASGTGRVVCMGAGFRVRVRRDSKGRIFETLHVICAAPCAENIGGFNSGRAAVKDIRQLKS